MDVGSFKGGDGGGGGGGGSTIEKSKQVPV